MDLLSYWKAVTSKNSAEKYIRGITGEKELTHEYHERQAVLTQLVGGHRKFVFFLDYDHLFFGLRSLFIQSFTHVLVGKSSLGARLQIIMIEYNILRCNECLCPRYHVNGSQLAKMKKKVFLTYPAINLLQI